MECTVVLVAMDIKNFLIFWEIKRKRSEVNNESVYY